MSTKNIINLAKDLASNKVTEFSAEESNDVLRKAFCELLGMEEYDSKISRRRFRKHKTEIFEIIEEVLDTNLDLDLRNQFEDWVEYRNLARGDKQGFYTPDDNLFKVAIISDGNQNLLRQRIRGGQRFDVETQNYGVKIYEELDRFLAGQVDWSNMIQLVALSFALQVRDDIMKAILDNFPEVGAEFKLTNVGEVPSEREIITLAQRVSARTRQRVSIYGTKLALHAVEPNVTSDAQDGERNATGYYSTIAGIDMYEIDQSLINGTDDFLVPDDFLLILPETRDRMVKVVNEGESFTEEGRPEGNASMDMEYVMTNRMGIAIVPSSVYGYISFSA